MVASIFLLVPLTLSLTLWTPAIVSEEMEPEEENQMGWGIRQHGSHCNFVKGDLQNLNKCNGADTFGFCNSSSMCQCISLRQIIKDGTFDNIPGGIDIESIEKLPVTFESIYDPETKFCQFTIGSACATDTLNLPALPDLPDFSFIMTILNCTNRAPCKVIGDSALDEFNIGRCTAPPNSLNCDITTNDIGTDKCGAISIHAKQIVIIFAFTFILTLS